MRERFAAIMAWAFLMGAPPVSHGLTIEMTDVGASPMTAQQLAAFRAAADIWELTYRDPVTVKLNIAWDSPGTFSGPTILGSTGSAFTTHKYEEVKLSMFFDADSAEELGAAAALPGGLKFLDLPCSPFFPVGCASDSVPLVDVNGTRDDIRVTMTTANAKALSRGTALDPLYGDALAGNADAQIRFNTSFASSFDYERSDGIASTQTDFVTTAAHEIGHALGFTSMADGQDAFPEFTLHPSTLDLRRFSQTGDDHNIKSETRQLTAGPAEYYDGVLNNRQFSRGKSVSDPQCNTFSGTCQASHWRDNLGNLMDPTIPRALTVNPTGDDRHALDYAGYDPNPFPFFVNPEIFRVAFFEPDDLTLPPGFAGAFDGFAPPPDGSEFFIDPKSPPDLAMRLGMSFGLPGLTGRSGLGLAGFIDEFFDPDAMVLDGGPLPEKGGINLLPPREAMTTIPARLTDFFFISDDSAGVPFVFIDAFSEDGAYFDPFLGEFGGFHISGFVDAAADKVDGDVDAMLSFLLLLNEDGGLPDGSLTGLLTEVDIAMIDNGLKVLDPRAFGLPVPEPRTLWLMAMSLVIVAARARGRRPGA